LRIFYVCQLEGKIMSKKVRLFQLFVNGLLILALAMSMSSSAIAQEKPDRQLPESVSVLKMDDPLVLEEAQVVMKIESSLLSAEGKQRVSVRLSEPEVAQVAAKSANRGEQQRQLARVKAQQENAAAKAVRMDADLRVLGTAQKALNVLLLEVDAAALREIAALPEVVSISKIKDYELDLSETVPYIGATAVQAMGYDGSGVRVAVLDTGIDYLHWNLGGSGDPAEFAANDPTIIEPGTFPTAKVVGGYDFVGDLWPSLGPEMPDPDPLDSGPGRGHGTHVADIIAGKSADGMHVGVAPNADLYAVKVCSSVSTSCSGVALLQAMDFVLDPNGDGDLSDRVDIVNMSLGSVYGQAYDDDLSMAVENAAAVGVLTVASAGNSADKPYVTGSPAASPSALSVAQTNVPSALQPLLEIVSPTAIAGLIPAEHQPWSPLPTELIEAPVQYGDGAGGNLFGCSEFAPDSLVGKIVLVDRGGCNFTLKIKNIGLAGGLAGIIGLVAPGDPFAGGDGGDRPIDVPGYMINQANSNRIKANLAEGVVMRLDPSTGIPLVMHMVGSSSEGPPC
jgi:minor extracellular serine protease Vpr